MFNSRIVSLPLQGIESSPTRTNNGVNSSRNKIISLIQIYHNNGIQKHWIFYKLFYFEFGRDKSIFVHDLSGLCPCMYTSVENVLNVCVSVRILKICL